MDRNNLFEVLYGKEKWDVWKEFQEIENSVESSDELYSYFDDIKNMLSDDQSYIRMRGFRMICKLAKWDKDNKINDIIDILLQILEDSKPTIVKQCLSSLNELLLYKTELSDAVQSKLKKLDLSIYKDSMAPLIQKDMDAILERL